jgi:hypothetical protein
MAAATLANLIISTALHGPQLATTVYGALLVAGVWAVHGHRTHDRAVAVGSLAQALTWDSFVRPRTLPMDDAHLYTTMAERMRQPEQHVRTFAGRHGLQRIWIALPSKPRNAFGEARSIRHDSERILWLGHRWFHPRHLPAVLEHELAHLLRHDTRKRLIAETGALTTTALAAGLLPLTTAVGTALTAWLAVIATRWWGELACDAHAIRTCGRTLVATMWDTDPADAQAAPTAPRTWNTVRFLHLHPPLRLRRWFARHATPRCRRPPPAIR